MLEIVKFNHPVLSRRCPEADLAEKEFLSKLSLEMVETCIHNNGAGLAAPQVAQSVRMFVMRKHPHNDADNSFITIINPSLLEVANPYTDVEGCLSFPGFAGKVERYKDILVLGCDLSGEAHEYYFDGFGARIFQHEADHVDGVTYIMKAKQLFRTKAH